MAKLQSLKQYTAKHLYKESVRLRKEALRRWTALDGLHPGLQLHLAYLNRFRAELNRRSQCDRKTYLEWSRTVRKNFEGGHVGKRQ